MKRILLPTDFSDNSKNAAEYAIRLYQNDEVQFIIINAYQVPHAGASMLTSIDDIMLKDANKSLEKFKENLCDDNPDMQLNIELKAVHGDPVTAVEKVIATQDISAVVMGTQGASGLKEVFVGSNTAAVIKNVRCPVIAVPENARFTPPNKIALSTDCKEFKNESVIDPLMELIKKFDAELFIFNVAYDKEMAEVGESMAAMKLHPGLKDVKHDFYFQSDEEIEHGVDQFLADHDIDVLAMVHRERKLFDRFFEGSFTKKMAMHTKVPLLALDDR